MTSERKSLFVAANAIQEAQTAAALEPRLGHQQLARLYSFIGVEEPALREAELAVSLDSSPSASYNLLVAMVVTGRFAEALARAKSLSFAEDFESMTNLARLRMGDEAAIEAVYSTPDEHSILRATALALRGRQAEAESEAKLAIAQFDPQRRTYFSDTYDLACFHAVQGRKDEAVKWLRATVDVGMPNYLLFHRDPLLSSIHEHPEYQRLMAELKPRWEKWTAQYQ